MANIIANEKRHHQDKKKHILLHSQLSAIKTQIKKTRITKSQNELSKAFKMIDSGISKGVISKNKGNRLKSQLTLFVNDINKKHIVKDIKKKKSVNKKFDKNAKKNAKLSNSQIKKIATKKETLPKNKGDVLKKIENYSNEKKLTPNVVASKNDKSIKSNKNIAVAPNSTKMDLPKKEVMNNKKNDVAKTIKKSPSVVATTTKPVKVVVTKAKATKKIPVATTTKKPIKKTVVVATKTVETIKKASSIATTTKKPVKKTPSVVASKSIPIKKVVTKKTSTKK